MKFIDLPVRNQQDFIRTMSVETDIPAQIIEKDWWVSAVMRAIFALPYADAMSFKGGTSLSKCWSLIERFSEDIDVAVSREFLGYGGELSRTQVSDKLRRAVCTFVREKLQFDIRDKMIEQGVNPDKFKVDVDITPVTTVDPEVIYVHYLIEDLCLEMLWIIWRIFVLLIMFIIFVVFSFIEQEIIVVQQWTQL